MQPSIVEFCRTSLSVRRAPNADFEGGGCQGIRGYPLKNSNLLSHCEVGKRTRPPTLHPHHPIPSAKQKDPCMEIKGSAHAVLRCITIPYIFNHSRNENNRYTGCFHVLRVVVHRIMGSYWISLWKFIYVSLPYVQYCNVL